MSTHCNFLAFTQSKTGTFGTFDVNIVRGVMGSGRSDAVYFDVVAHAVKPQDLPAFLTVIPQLMDNDPRHFWAYYGDKKQEKYPVAWIKLVGAGTEKARIALAEDGEAGATPVYGPHS